MRGTREGGSGARGAHGTGGGIDGATHPPWGAYITGVGEGGGGGPAWVRGSGGTVVGDIGIVDGKGSGD